MCKVCLIRHDPKIHAATLSIHKWFRSEIKRKLAVIPQGDKRRAAPGFKGRRKQTSSAQGRIGAIARWSRAKKQLKTT